MTVVEKLLSATFFTIGLTLVLTNPDGFKTGVGALSGAYNSGVKTFIGTR